MCQPMWRLANESFCRKCVLACLAGRTCDAKTACSLLILDKCTPVARPGCKADGPAVRVPPAGKAAERWKSIIAPANDERERFRIY
jgi:hypothetical protein